MRDVTTVAGEERDFITGEVDGVDCDQARAEQAGVMEPLQRPHLVLFQALLDFMRCFVQVYLHGKIEFAGIGGDLAQVFVADCVGGVRRKTKMQQRLVFHFVAKGETFAQIILRIRSIGRRKIDHDHADRSTHPRRDCGTRRVAREEIHVVEAGGPAAQHFRAGEPRAIVDKGF